MATPTLKPGWKTTEFWLMLAAEVIGLLLAAGIVQIGNDTTVGKIVGGAIAVLAALGYTVNRSKLKRK